MKHHDQFEQEIEMRNRLLKHHNVCNGSNIGDKKPTTFYTGLLPILVSYDGTIDPSIASVLSDHGFATYPHVFVLPAADKSLEIMINGNLITNDVVIHYTKQIVSALSYLHTAGVIHGDIKSRNIVVVDNHAILIDMDASTSINSPTGSKVSPVFMAPEVANISSVIYRLPRIPTVQTTVFPQINHYLHHILWMHGR